MGNSVLKFENVTFRRDLREILSGVNWELKYGEQWALLGANGSGKSTLLGMVPAYTFPTSGNVSAFGHTFGKYNWERVKSRVGFVSSTLNLFLGTLHSEMVVNVVLSGKFSSIGIYKDLEAGDYKKADDIIEDFGLTYIRNNYFHTLSEGEKRRVLIARAFMNDYDMMILDEPCANLDIKSREYLLKTLNNKCKESKNTIIYVTHSIEEIIPATTHVALLHGGKIMCAGKKEDILTDENLSNAFEIPIKVHFENGRYMIIPKSFE